MKSYLYRLIWLGLISFCIPVIIAGVVYYNTSMKREIAHIQTNNQTSLGIIQTYIDNAMFSSIEDLSRMAFESDIFESFQPADGFDKVANNTSILKGFTSLLQRNKFISSLFYYNMNSGTLLSSTQGNIDKALFKYKNDLDILASNNRTAYWTYLPESRQDGYISLVLTLPATSLKPQGVLVAQVEVTKINNYLSTFLSITKNRSIFVMNSTDKLLFHSNLFTNVDGAIGEQIMETMASSNLKNGNGSIRDTNGMQYFYSFSKSSSSTTYVSVIPRSEIVKELSWILWSTIFAVAVFLLIGIFMTIFNSRRAYSPIGQLVDYVKRLSKEAPEAPQGEISFIRNRLDYFNDRVKSLSGWVAKSEPYLLERFMQQLLEGNYYSLNTLYEDCKQYGVPTDCTYVVLTVRVEDFGKTSRFQFKDKPLLTYAVINVMKELLSELTVKNGFVFYDVRGHEIATLCFDSEVSGDYVLNETKRFAETICNALQTYLNLRVSIGIGRSYPHIGDIALSYRDSILALQFRLLKETESILSIDETLMEKQTMPEYPYAIESKIIEALLNEDQEAFETEIRQFNKMIMKKESYYFIYQSYYVLLAQLISTAEKKCGTPLGMLEYNLFDQLRTHQTADEIGQWFIETLPALYAQVMKDNNKTVGKAIVKKVCAYIADNVSSNISLTECAERFHINPSYLSRLFKKETGTTLHDYLTNCKLNEAKRLLTESDQNVSEIAAMVGYSHRTFNRIFQQLYQMSPSDFRNQHR